MGSTREARCAGMQQARTENTGALGAKGHAESDFMSSVTPGAGEETVRNEGLCGRRERRLNGWEPLSRGTMARSFGSRDFIEVNLTGLEERHLISARRNRECLHRWHQVRNSD